MHPAEQNLREKAEAFKLAFHEARDAGFNIIWPMRGNQIGEIVISGTAKVASLVTDIDGTPIERDAHGVIAAIQHSTDAYEQLGARAEVAMVIAQSAADRQIEKFHGEASKPRKK